MGVTLLIQGKINEHGLRMIDRYKDQYPIVVSTNAINDATHEALEAFGSAVKVILYQLPISLEHVMNTANCYLQTVSVYYGLREVNTEYVIKFRGDEYYSEITPLVRAVTRQEKLVTADIFFRKQLDYNQIYLYHTSDHYFGGRTRHLLEAFQHMKRMYEEVRYSQEVEPDLSFQYSLVFEQKMTIAYLLARGERNLPKDTAGATKLLLKYVDMVKARDLGDHTVVTANVFDKVYINEYGYYEPKIDIADLSELLLGI
jgi:hypothetical protein